MMRVVYAFMLSSMMNVWGEDLVRFSVFIDVGRRDYWGLAVSSLHGGIDECVFVIGGAEEVPFQQ